MGRGRCHVRRGGGPRVARRRDPLGLGRAPDPAPPGAALAPGRLGCGTGTLALLASELGHDVVGVDFSAAMLQIARSKARGRARVRFLAGDAASPPLTPTTFDAVLCRHVLWALPDPAAALRTWVRLLRPGGRLVLVEGPWSTGAGLPGRLTVDLLRQQGLAPVLEPLTAARYWGAPVEDERYVVTAAARPTRDGDSGPWGRRRDRRTRRRETVRRGEPSADRPGPGGGP
ncbi:class I SAM-dependent methyltransferase [Friedmanniella luteola]|uniref:class I SAM-dependent methyltransferase n=1 Tax=Friedmanniella luteola TaxID=546871 RepID=UPI0018D4BC7A|nr:class I SAM-dependent methyltransferase [Friedmanniella luteola]